MQMLKKNKREQKEPGLTLEDSSPKIDRDITPDLKQDFIEKIETTSQELKSLQKEENQFKNKINSLLSEIDSAQIQISNLCHDIERDYNTINSILKDFDQDLAKKQATGLHSALRYQSAIIHKIKGTLLDDQGRIGNMVSNTKIIDRTIKTLKKKTEE